MSSISSDNNDPSQTPPFKKAIARIPAPVVYTILILLLSIVVLFLLRGIFSTKNTIESRFFESLNEVRSNNGDVLEIATYKNTTFFEESDKIDYKILGLTISGGETVVSMHLPVTYRFHVLLSDHWKIETTPETVTVIAPEIRPSLPPAPDISGMVIRTQKGILRFNVKEIEQRITAQVTGKLNIRAYEIARSQLISDAARHSIEKFIRNDMTRFSSDCSKKIFSVRMRSEHGGNKMEAYHDYPDKNELH